MIQRLVIMYPGDAGDWVVECPSLPGCITRAPTREEAIRYIKEEIVIYIEALADQGEPIPEDQFEFFVVSV
ncbi:MAG TPA: type II toxin-antitoxin system HicB family antitoxin [Phototrophicaceae bacterium]|jgi:predicted RNase H-like HicB family nuclease|nr:type II toxin-antitoxin system HicB family antitoxin [Phototrophicaceae bacterium]